MRPIGRVSISGLALVWALAAASAQAQDAPAPSQLPSPSPTQPASQPASQPTTQAEPPAGSAEDASAPAADDELYEEVVVTGRRPFGAVNSDIKPEQQLSQADIRSYGVSSVSELLTELAPQTNAAAGQPVVLLNGKRISGMSEIRDIPPEAIQRVEILPEDVSLAYGYAANQKVVNIVLRRRFRAMTGEVTGGTTTEGGRENGRVSVNSLQIRQQTRFNLNLAYSAADSLKESERDIDPTTPGRPFALAGNVTGAPGASEIDPALSALAGRPVTIAGVPVEAANGRPALSAFVPGANAQLIDDLGRYRTLSAATDNLAINAVLSKPLSANVSASLNARVEFSGTDSLQGLPGLTMALPTGNPFSPFSTATQLYRYTDATGPLKQRGRTSDIHLGGTLNGQIKDWYWTFTGNYDRTVTRTYTERGIDATALQAALNAGDPTLNPFGTLPPHLLATRLADSARGKTESLTGDFLLTGSPFVLPAGKATAAITISGAANDFASRSMRSGIPRELDFSRDLIGVKGSLDLPIASRRNNVLAALGDLSINANAEVQHLSDYGRLTTIGYGLRWSPIPEIRFIASMSHDSAAASGQQINNPVVVTPNVPVFDYRSGETVFVSQVSGGNPALLESERRRLRLSVTVKPWSEKDFTLTGLFTDNRTDNPIGNFPVPTPQIEAAFPGRFVRDPDGTLVQVDTRPINFDEQRSTALRYGFNFSVPIKSALQKKVEAWRAAGSNPEDRPAELTAMREMFMRDRQRRNPGGGQRAVTGAGSGAEGQTPPAAGEQPSNDGPPRGEGGRRGDGGGGGSWGGGGRGFGGGGGGFGGGGRGGGGAGGRLQFAMFHTWHLNETIRIAPGVTRLDLLDGAAIGGSGGQPRHEFEAQAGYSNNGLGARMSANYRTGSRVDGALGATDSTLHFGGLATLDLRLFASLGQMPELVRDYPFLRGSRVTLSLTNLFDAKQDVRDASGAVPLSYQPDYLDPLGRRVMVSFRKQF